jgi:hypothetical protein
MDHSNHFDNFTMTSKRYSIVEERCEDLNTGIVTSVRRMQEIFADEVNKGIDREPMTGFCDCSRPRKTKGKRRTHEEPPDEVEKAGKGQPDKPRSSSSSAPRVAGRCPSAMGRRSSANRQGAPLHSTSGTTRGQAPATASSTPTPSSRSSRRQSPAMGQSGFSPHGLPTTSEDCPAAEQSAPLHPQYPPDRREPRATGRGAASRSQSHSNRRTSSGTARRGPAQPQAPINPTGPPVMESTAVQPPTMESRAMGQAAQSRSPPHSHQGAPPAPPVRSSNSPSASREEGPATGGSVSLDHGTAPARVHVAPAASLPSPHPPNPDHMGAPNADESASPKHGAPAVPGRVDPVFDPLRSHPPNPDSGGAPAMNPVVPTPSPPRSKRPREPRHNRTTTNQSYSEGRPRCSFLGCFRACFGMTQSPRGQDQADRRAHNGDRHRVGYQQQSGERHRDGTRTDYPSDRSSPRRGRRRRRSHRDGSRPVHVKAGNFEGSLRSVRVGLIGRL